MFLKVFHPADFPIYAKEDNTSYVQREMISGP